MKSKVIAVAQSKGGVGKSTVCANLAVTLAQSAKVLMIDCDPPQYSVSAWFKVREQEYEETDLDLEQAATASQLLKLVETSLPNYDYIVIDGAPQTNSLVRAMLLVSNLVIVPLAPSSVEIWSFKGFEELIEKAQTINKSLQARICWNRVRKRVKSSQQIMQEANKSSKFSALKGVLTFRVAYMDSFASGCSVYEWNDSVASAEIWSFSSSIKRLLNKSQVVKLVKSTVAQNFIKKG
jgi:chromosome partitioning protein